MSTLITRMAGVRQGVALASTVVVLVIAVQTFFAPVRQPIPLSLFNLLIGTAMSVWSVEEHLRGNKVFRVLFAVMGIALVGLSGWQLFR